MVNPHEEKCVHEKFYGKIPYYDKNLRTFGEIVVARSIATVKEKPYGQGKTCMLLGYAQNYTGGTYRMLNLRTKRIVLSCDVIWLKNPTESTCQGKKTPSHILISYKFKTSPINGIT